MIQLLFPFFLASASAFNWTEPNLGRTCKPLENGTAPGIKYYRDRDSFEILPFFYRGCGGDENRFDNRSVAPMIMDFSPCPGYPNPVGNGCNTGQYPGSQPKPCPSTAYCQQGFPFNGFGKCCDSGARERDAENREAPHCKAAGLATVKEKRSYGEVNLLGRNCSHNFCPQGSNCHQGEFYAYCCWKPSSSLRNNQGHLFIQPNPGRLCAPGEKGAVPGIYYYADGDTNQVFPFYYHGCGGDQNRYSSRSLAPIMLDELPCPGNPRSTGICTSRPVLPGQKEKRCRADSYCIPSWNPTIPGQCCSSDARNKELANRSAPKCLVDGLQPVMEKQYGRETILIGRKCYHSFCPIDTECHQGEFYAYCCEKKDVVHPLH